MSGFIKCVHSYIFDLFYYIQVLDFLFYYGVLSNCLVVNLYFEVEQTFDIIYTLHLSL